MSQAPPDYLYGLIPEMYRRSDAAEGYPLRALLAILESQLRALQGNMEDLYENWFIETCEDWVVPYLGELLAVDGLNDTNSPVATQRTRVANTLSFRGRKGIGFTIEDSILDATGWYARVVAASELLGVDQNVQSVRLQAGRLVDVRDTRALADLGGPFDTIAWRPEAREQGVPTGNRPAPLRGRYNLPNAPVFVWRIPAYTLQDIRPFPINPSSPPNALLPGWARATCDPLGRDLRLLNQPDTSAGRDRTNGVAQLPVLLTREMLADDIASAPPDARDSGLYGPERGLSVSFDSVPVPPARVRVASLAWDTPGWGLNLTRGLLDDSDVVIDPERGRLLVRCDPLPDGPLGVRYTHGLSGPIGGGPYNRKETLADPASADFYGIVDDTPVYDARHVPHFVAAGSPLGADGLARMPIGNRYLSLMAAIDAWNEIASAWDLQGRTELLVGVIEIVNGNTYTLPTGAAVNLAERSRLTIQASNASRPAIVGDLQAKGHVTDLGDYDERSLILNGLLMDGQITLEHNLSLLVLHCTLTPSVSRPSIVHAATGEPGDPLSLTVSARFCITGPILLPPTAGGLTVAESVIDAVSHGAVAIGPVDPASGHGPALDLRGVTVFGTTSALEFVEASDCLFMGLVDTQRVQVGEMRYSYAPMGSDTPRRLRCQPDLAVDSGKPAARVRPVFTSVDLGDPGYAQLAVNCPVEITEGAADGSQMGAFRALNLGRLMGNLSAALSESLALGLEPGIVIVT